MIDKLRNILTNENGFSDIATGTMLLLLVAAVGLVALALAMSATGGLP